MSIEAIYYTDRARFLKRTLGTRCAAGFLRNRRVAIHDALAILVPGAKFRPRTR